MKTKLIALAIGSSLLLASPVLRAEDTGTTTPPAGGGRHHKEGGPKGDHLLPPRLEEKLNLTEDQKTKIKAIEESFDKTRKEYYEAHKTDIEAAKTSGDESKKKEVKGGLIKQRKDAVDQIRSLLSDEQKKTWDEAKENFKEHHGKGKGHRGESGGDSGGDAGGTK